MLDIEEEDAVSFKMRNTFQFRPDLGLSGQELITMPHPLLQVSSARGISRVDYLQATATTPAFQFMTLASLAQPTEMQAAIAQGLEQLLKPQSAFITASFMELFFDGFDINCAQEHPAAQAICQQFQAGAVPGAVPVNATHYKFSLMGAASRESSKRKGRLIVISPP